MIKTGLRLPAGNDAQLIRMLVKHPDVDLLWISGQDGSAAAFDELLGEVSALPSNPDLQAIDLYIGPDFNGLDAFLGANTRSKAILTASYLRPAEQSDGTLGVCEYNRKALVRGARLALQPDAVTLLGALALMPLAKNLLLNTPIQGTMILPRLSRRGICVSSDCMPESAFTTLRQQILEQLQTSFTAPFEVQLIEVEGTGFACVTFTLDIKLAADHVKQLYTDFYDDHRHVVITTGKVTERMVAGSNKTVISLGQDARGRLIVTAAFDSAYKAAAGNLLHILNLLFGLDELTGF